MSPVSGMCPVAMPRQVRSTEKSKKRKLSCYNSIMALLRKKAVSTGCSKITYVLISDRHTDNFPYYLTKTFCSSLLTVRGTREFGSSIVPSIRCAFVVWVLCHTHEYFTYTKASPQTIHRLTFPSTKEKANRSFALVRGP